jgi:hypothetical protein
MRRGGLVTLSFAVATAGIACTGGSTGSAGTPCTGPGPCTPTTTPAGAGLTGTWDLVASRVGKPQETGTVELSAERLRVVMGQSELSYEASGPTLTWQIRASASPDAIAVQHTAAGFDSGDLALALGGTWSFTEGQSSCAGTVGDGSGSAQCKNARLPAIFPRPSDGATYTATRTGTASSSFGAFGGTWSFVAASQTQGCTASFAGSTITLGCTRVSGSLDATVTITFNGSTLSGTTSAGTELAGTRR